MARFKANLRVWLASLLAGLATVSAAPAATMIEDAASACGGLAGASDAVRIDSATLQAPSQLAVSERGPTPAAPPQVFARNDAAFENFAHRSYKKVRDPAVALMARAYGKPPEKMYFVGS